MQFTPIPGAAGICTVQNTGGSPVLSDTQSALDLLVNGRYNCGCARFVLHKADIAADFFDLKTRIAGEILQKFVNYGGALAIVGDFSAVQSKSLRDFIYESNKGTTVFFVPTQEDAVAKLRQIP